VVALDHVDIAIAVHADALGPHQIAQHQAAPAQDAHRQGAVGRKHLDAAVERVGHVQLAQRKGQVAGVVELARPGAAPAQRAQQAAAVVEDLDVVGHRVSHVQPAGAGVTRQAGGALQQAPADHALLGIGHPQPARGHRQAAGRDEAQGGAGALPQLQLAGLLVEDEHRLAAGVADVQPTGLVAHQA